MITVDEILKNRISRHDLKPDYRLNLNVLLAKINVVRKCYGMPMSVSSGYRSPEDNRIAGGAPNSLHMKCAAVDIKDENVKLWKWCLTHLPLLKLEGIWLEDKRWTPSWVHFQIFSPLSGRRIFVPSARPPLDPKIWDGVYDRNFD